MKSWSSRRARYALLQALYVASLATIILSFILLARVKLAQQGINSGFDFLWKSTGWEMTFALVPTSPSDPYWWVLLMGFLNTLLVGVLGLTLATGLGIVIGTARISSNTALRMIGTVYVQLVRNVPLLVQVFFWYALITRLPSPKNAINIGGVFLSNRGLYVPRLNVEAWATLASAAIFAAMLLVCLWLSVFARAGWLHAKRQPLMAGSVASALAIMTVLFVMGHQTGTPFVDEPVFRGLNFRGGSHIQPEFFTIVLAIAIFGGAYVGEIVRGGFLAVSRGQIEAARSLGLKTWHVFSRIQFPLAMRAMLPMLTNQYIWLIKATTLGIVVGFADLFMVIATAITQSGQTLEMLGILMGAFLLINITIATVSNRINSAIALKGHQARG